MWQANRFWLVFSALAGSVVVLAIGANQTGQPICLTWLKVLGAFWAFAPPAWFLWEWYLYKGPTKGEEFEVFKLNQERAKDLWLGLGAALIILFGLKG